MEPEKPLVQGILLLPPQGMLGQLKKTWHKRFCQLFKASNYGIERVEIYDNHEEAVLHLHSPRIITLEACVKITPSNQTNVFTVVTKTGVHHFGCYSESDMRNWITAFQSVAFKDKLATQILEENSDLYCTNGEGVFSVKVIETDASKRCGLETKYYTLVVAAVDIKLLDGDIVLFTWPYRYIRRYGYKDGKFIFEAGRKCESGEGSFRLEHTSQKEIFRCISSKMKSMKKMLSSPSTESSPSIECNDAQYHAALSMEAGSRSPLPPSPKISGNLIDVDFSTISQNSQKQSSSTSSSDGNPFNKPLPPLIKPKPAKPPRKYVFTPLMERKSSDPEFPDSPVAGDYRQLFQTNSPELSQKTTSSLVSDDEKHSYDLVEVRNDAWKTHGIDSIHHTERINMPDQKNDSKQNDIQDCQYETMMPIHTSQSSCSAKESVMFTTSSIHSNASKRTDEPDYDRLQNFGSATKLNQKLPYKMANVSNASKEMHSNTSQGACSNPPPAEACTAWSNYDIVEDMSAVRLADDSHLGYGVIRKKAGPPETSATNVGTMPQQKVFNDSEYAIVSKPKRV